MTNNLLEIKNTNSDCAKYTGTVTVTSYLGDRLIQKQTTHNAGLRNLFKFIGSCLQGHFQEAKSIRPCKLVMLEKGTDEDLVTSAPSNTDAKDSDGNSYWSSKYAVCNPILHDTALPAETTAGANPSSSVTYHFRVPFLSLVGGKIIQKLMLLPSSFNTTDYSTDACAYITLDEAINVPTASGNFTVIIDWKLTFTND